MLVHTLPHERYFLVSTTNKSKSFETLLLALSLTFISIPAGSVQQQQQLFLALFFFSFRGMGKAFHRGLEILQQ